MNAAYAIVPSLDEFKAAREQFGYLTSKLQSDETVRLEHGEVESLVNKDGTEILRRLFQGYLDLRAGREETEELLIMSMDGKGIVMRKEGLREVTRKAAERSRNKLCRRLSSGEKKNRKRMAMVGAVYSVAAHIRTAEEMMNLEDSPVWSVKKCSTNLCADIPSTSVPGSCWSMVMRINSNTFVLVFGAMKPR